MFIQIRLDLRKRYRVSGEEALAIAKRGPKSATPSPD